MIKKHVIAWFAVYSIPFIRLLRMCVTAITFFLDFSPKTWSVSMKLFFTVNHKIWLLKHRQIEGTPMGSNCAHIVSSPGEILWSSSSKILVPCKTLMTWQPKGIFFKKNHCINYWPSLLKLISPPPPQKTWPPGEGVSSLYIYRNSPKKIFL